MEQIIITTDNSWNYSAKVNQRELIAVRYTKNEGFAGWIIFENKKQIARFPKKEEAKIFIAKELNM